MSLSIVSVKNQQFTQLQDPSSSFAPGVTPAWSIPNKSCGGKGSLGLSFFYYPDDSCQKGNRLYGHCLESL